MNNTKNIKLITGFKSYIKLEYFAKPMYLYKRLIDNFNTEEVKTRTLMFFDILTKNEENKTLLDSLSKEKIDEIIIDNKILKLSNSQVIQSFFMSFFQKRKKIILKLHIFKNSFYVLKGAFFSTNIAKFIIEVKFFNSLKVNLAVKFLRLLAEENCSILFNQKFERYGIKLASLIMGLSSPKAKLSGTRISIDVTNIQYFSKKLFDKLKFIKIYINAHKISKLKDALRFVSNSSRLITDNIKLKRKCSFSLDYSLNAEILLQKPLIWTYLPQLRIEDNCTIFLKLGTGYRGYTYESKFNQTIRPNKQYLSTQIGTNVNSIRMIFAGKELLEEKTIAENGLINESTIHVVMKL